MGDSWRVIASRGFRWDGVELERYKSDPSLFDGVTRQVLLGGAGEEALALELRYFEVEPGGYTTLERHRHPHAVIVLRGRGSAVLGSDSHRIQSHDCVYIPPELVHQFRADCGETLGFVCVVDRVRDRARPVPTDRPEM